MSDRAIDADAVLRSVVKRWNAAAAPLSAAAMTQVYTEDALFFGGLAEISVGRPAIEQYFRQYDGWLPSMELRLRDMHFREVGADTLIAQGFADFDFDLADGRVTHATLRATWVMVREAEAWRIRLHHFSPPPAVTPVPH